MVLPKDAESRLKEKIQKETHALISWAERSQFRFQPMVRKGKASLEILLTAEEEKPDLIVMGTKGKTGMKHILLGSVAEQVVRRAGVPVWISRGSSHNLPQKILVPVDFSEYSRQALEQGIQWARELKAELYVLHVADLRYLYALDPLGLDTRPELETQLKKEAEEQLKDWSKSISIPANLEVRLGGAVFEIQDSIQENAIDLVLLSTHGRSGLKHLLMGSVAEQVVRYSPCSVMTICPPALALSRVKLFDGEKDFEDYVRDFRN
jgi:nucleotide-binding universal stress UspA family protein